MYLVGVWRIMERMTVRPSLVAGVSATAWALVLAPMYRPPDVQIGVDAGRALLGGDLAVYAHMPEAQMGPLALVLAALPRPVYLLLVAGALAVFVHLADRLGAPRRAQLVIGLAVSLPWAMFALEGHADDVLVLISAAVMLVGVRERSDWWIVGGFVLAASGKPTAAILVGLLVLAGWRATVMALGLAASMWAPFVLADVHGFASAGRGIQTVQAWSAPWLLGSAEGAAFPGWVRPVQMLVGVALCWALARRGELAAGLLVAFGWRVMLEPGVWFSYSTTLIALALLLPRRPYSVAALALASWCFAHEWGGAGAVNGLGRLACIAALCTVAAITAMKQIRQNGEVRYDQPLRFLKSAAQA